MTEHDVKYYNHITDLVVVDVHRVPTSVAGRQKGGKLILHMCCKNRHSRMC